MHAAYSLLVRQNFNARPRARARAGPHRSLLIAVPSESPPAISIKIPNFLNASFCREAGSVAGGTILLYLTIGCRTCSLLLLLRAPTELLNPPRPPLAHCRRAAAAVRCRQGQARAPLRAVRVAPCGNSACLTACRPTSSRNSKRSYAPRAPYREVRRCIAAGTVSTIFTRCVPVR